MPCAPAKQGVRITLRITPKAAANAITGTRPLADGRRALYVKVSAAPEDGKANAAMIRLLAKSLGVGRTQVELLSGHTSRHKEVLVRGDKDAIMAALQPYL